MGRKLLRWMQNRILIKHKIAVIIVFFWLSFCGVYFHSSNIYISKIHVWPLMRIEFSIDGCYPLNNHIYYVCLSLHQTKFALQSSKRICLNFECTVHIRSHWNWIELQFNNMSNNMTLMYCKNPSRLYVYKADAFP